MKILQQNASDYEEVSTLLRLVPIEDYAPPSFNLAPDLAPENGQQNCTFRMEK
jgi:hypothetical protein